MSTAPWSRIADLIESVAGSEGLIAETVEEVRAARPEMAGLDAADVARHTRALLAAATRALAARRGPTEAELSFVEDLAVTRARQGIPIEAVLSAIHVAQRRIWAQARALGEAAGVRPAQLLDARELYDDWSESVRVRLIAAHRQARDNARAAGHDRPGLVLRRLLDGGAAAALAAAEVGLRPTAVSVLVVPGLSREEATALVARLRGRGAAGLEAGVVVAVVGRVGDELAQMLAGLVAGAAGPGAAEEIPALRRLAGAAAEVAQLDGRLGVTKVADVAVRVALDGRGDLAAAVLERFREGTDRLGRAATATVETTRVWLEAGCDTDRAAAVVFVHPNTVRNRVGALTRATGLDPDDPFQAVTLWWLCRAWTAGAGGDSVSSPPGQRPVPA